MSGVMRACLALICCGLLVVACGEEEEGNGENGDAFEGGSFTVTVDEVDDQCFDGAMNTVILPEGEAVELPQPVSLPGLDELPAQTDITFNDPFHPAEGVDLEASGDNGMQIADGGIEQTDVDIETDEDGECLTQLTIDAELITTGEDTLTGTGTLTISEAEGDDCPAFTDEPPCEVTTDISAARD